MVFEGIPSLIASSLLSQLPFSRFCKIPNLDNSPVDMQSKPKASFR